MKNDDLHPHLHEEQLESIQLFRGKLLDLRRDRVRLPDGQECLREYVRHQGAVAIIALHDDGQLLFVRQYRYPLSRSFIELPAGKIDPGEDILATGRRELLEETGYSAAEWRHLGVMHPCVGYSDERIEIFLARGLQREGRTDAGQRRIPRCLQPAARRGDRSGARGRSPTRKPSPAFSGPRRCWRTAGDWPARRLAAAASGGRGPRQPNRPEFVSRSRCEAESEMPWRF
jgi:ADP-ribose pyrophosphatase